MNLQSHMSGQFSGQVSNQDGNSLQVVPQQNGDSLSTQMQNPGGHHNTGTMDPDFVKARRYEFFMRRQQQAHEIAPKVSDHKTLRGGPMQNCYLKGRVHESEYAGKSITCSDQGPARKQSEPTVSTC